jgi:hypothetical protein
MRKSSKATLVGDLWSKLEFDLSELRDLFRMRLEAKEEGIGRRIAPSKRKARKKPKLNWERTSPKWVDDEHGKTVPAWLMIPYVDPIDQESLRQHIDAGRRLLESVERRIAARQVSPELLHEWGMLNRSAGALQIAFQARPDVGRLREGSDNLDAHKRWFAHYYLKLRPRPRRDDAIEVIEKLINSTVVSLPEGPERRWFSKFLGSEESLSLENALRLTKAFREKLSVSEMRALDGEPLDIVPPFALDVPHPRGGLE